ncbi:MAG: hypothetical protein HOO99_03955 [Hyphomicrobiaceae bacterium]|nr:hypothetical protein [Hyphomicrobiaceae bacterium]
MKVLHPFFGPDPDSYNLEGYDSSIEDASDASGRPGIGIVANAILFWVGQQNGKATVAECARAFVMPPAAVVEAVAFHHFMLVTGNLDGPFDEMSIEQDGE